jgi:plastocyanin
MNNMTHPAASPVQRTLHVEWLLFAGAMLAGVLFVVAAVNYFVPLASRTARSPQAVQLNGPSGSLTVETRLMAYGDSELRAEEGTITLELVNEDLMPHTFTVDELGIDFKVGGNDSGEVTFEAPAGTYRFYCSKPGHEALGMAGIMVVE